MSISKKINIKSLPQTLEIADGDFLVVEKSDGTYVLDYADVVLETGKTAITTQVDENTTAIADLSATMETRVSDLSAQVYSDMPRVYIGRATVTIGSGSQSTANLTPRPTSDVPVLIPSDFIITPANEAACRYPGVVSYVENFEEHRGYFTIDADLKKTIYTVTIDNAASLVGVSSTVSSTLTSSSLTAKISGFSISDLISNLGVTSNAINTVTDTVDGSYLVQAETIKSTVEELLVYPQYYVTVIKEY